MSSTGRGARPASGLALVAARAGIQGLFAAGLIVSAHFLGPADFGILASGLAVSSVALAAGACGVDQLALQRVISFAELRRGATAIGAGSALLCLVFAAAWPGLSAGGRVCAAVIGLGYSLDWMRIGWYVEPQLELDFTARARREITARSLPPICLIAATWIHPGSWRVATAAMFGGFVLGHLLARRSFAVPVRSTVRLVRRGLQYGLSAALYTAYFAIDQALLVVFANARDVGEYRLAASVFSAAVLLPVVFNNEVMRSRLMRATSESSDRGEVVARAVRSGLVSTLASAAVAILAMVLVVAPLVPVVLGSSYGKVAGLVRLLAIAVAPNFLSSWAANVVIGLGRVTWVVRTQLALLIGNIALNLAVLPVYGARGACVTTIATEATGLAVYLVLNRRLRRRSQRVPGAQGSPVLPR